MTGGTIAYQPELAPAIAVPRPDPRVRRTHLALHQAMVALCLEVGYRSVTIDQLVDLAGVTRATFYTHFRDRLRVVLRGEGDGVALRLFTERVAEVIAELDDMNIAAGALPLAVDAQLAVRAMAGQITEVLRWWLDTDPTEFPRLPREQVVAQLRTAAILGRLRADDPRRTALRGEEPRS